MRPTLPSQFIQFIDQCHQELIEQYGSPNLERFTGFINHLTGRKLLKPADSRQRNGETTELWYPDLAAKPWHDTATLPWVKILESSFPAIRDEVTAVLAGKLKFKEPDVVVREDFDYVGWDNYHFQRLGKISSFLEQFPENLELCPNTAAVLDKIPLAGDAKFAIMQPGGYLKPHFSTFNGRLVCHLGLIVPANCAIRVADEIREWKEGATILFDDTYEHEAWNRGNTLRAVLLLDMWHPDLTEIEIICLEMMLSKVSSIDLTKFGI